MQDRLMVATDEITLRATSASLLAAEVRIPAGGGPPALHRHAPEEIYRGEAGELAVYCEDDDGEVQRIPVGPGDVVHIPGGRSHTVRNESAAEARAYVVFSPGVEMERFVRAAAQLRSPTPADVMALARRHGIEFAHAAVPA
ncbi:MAG TPA: cupin domain-containing protein [Solirubrobacter sp.]|nr:cupin domain-containing protein [Solirubrobacter sp.]